MIDGHMVFLDDVTGAKRTIDWRGSTGVQPSLAGRANLRIDVSIGEQVVRVYSGNDVIYTMIASTGINDWTPRGHYTIRYRGDSFYNAREGMGARNWVGFIGTTYLFHSVPTDAAGNYIPSEAEKLGSPASHGCVRLTVGDAVWFRDQVPDGTPVDIR